MNKRTPVQFTVREKIMGLIYSILVILISIVLIFCVIQIISYYFYCIITNGYFCVNSLNYGLYIIGGASLFLFIYRNELKKIFKIKQIDA